MKERDFKDQAFRITGRVLDVYGIYFLINLLASLLAGVAVLLIIDMTVEALLGDLEGWARVGVTGSMLLGMIATSYGVFFFWERRRERWLEKRSVPSEDGGDEAAEAA